MKLRSLLTLLVSFCIITSCRNGENKEDDLISPETESSYETNTPSGDRRQSSPASSSSTIEDNSNPGSGTTAIDDNINDSETSASVISQGKYIKEGAADPSCDCFCIDINFSANTELCLKEETIFITGRMSKGSDGVVNIYFVEPASGNTEGDDIPWNDFDKNTPIASITPTSNGQIELDWLGFSINGDLAMDYAIYGKKTLEGIYKKK
ncbi:hypothetical protein FHG64_13790 [Antarcticibacterium flavum]|uniref:Lipoprotein n=1 Tax=Antarcticibacterium flavum TaxID=2058175 RepID=A0A5B7X6X8_9FLAO|nr:MULTISPECIES: hypothetical protein [Antarcticibacterium]MCM4160021.1 hypothetical protein [Antarcticibacterium sp. W02-3]QCY70391.1 hypothetical protein FHG64_13790 [Antarcticibacterium flavum]